MKRQSKFPTLKKGTFFCGGIVYPNEQFKEVLEAWFADKPLPKSRLV
jgi:hypothetical protein